MTPQSSEKVPNEPVIENRKARNTYSIGETLECGIQLRGTEIKSIRASQISLAEGWVRVHDQPLALSLHGVHIAEYPPAGANRQHEPVRTRNLLAHKREMFDLSIKMAMVWLTVTTRFRSEIRIRISPMDSTWK